MRTCNSDACFSSKTCEWETPQDLFDQLNDEFHFTLDVCATAKNAKCQKYFTKESDGLKQSWQGHTVWCNPPYGKGMELWIQKCHDHAFLVGGYSSNAYSCQDRYKSIP